MWCVNITFTSTDDNPDSTSPYVAPRFNLPMGFNNLREFNNCSFSASGDFDSASKGEKIGSFDYPGINEVPKPDYTVLNLIFTPGKAIFLRTTIFDANTPIASEMLYIFL